MGRGWAGAGLHAGGVPLWPALHMRPRSRSPFLCGQGLGRHRSARRGCATVACPSRAALFTCGQGLHTGCTEGVCRSGLPFARGTVCVARLYVGRGWAGVGLHPGGAPPWPSLCMWPCLRAGRGQAPGVGRGYARGGCDAMAGPSHAASFAWPVCAQAGIGHLGLGTGVHTQVRRHVCVLPFACGPVSTACSCEGKGGA
jgi:hypothetical protein